MYGYPCPGCRTTTGLHAPDCGFGGTPRSDIEKAYVDIVAVLSVEEVSRERLRGATHGEWDRLHEAALTTLRKDSRVLDGDSGLELVPPDELADRVEPTTEPIRTVYEHGSVPGAHDNSVFAMVAYYRSKGLPWEETKAAVVQWLRESGTWERGGFEEATPEALLEKKRHVYEREYGWRDKARAAKHVIESALGS
jgi:hypothetical protein